ncbi:ribulose-phosphate 3-epimerase [Burkholderia sp. SRS-W-2-2016]|uniref:ribulose-phosphate 3-epimerase n=1 Tax=Burkholderia sp. SRS-W-2-2016 TaxID=1926878 RepID=UPI00094AE123|nr:ribulose-phosphate 3-epimerase [Burkholderia sp. SRS-W-2-2016]OLL31515.1 ribulose-phosphate 3-epimerase [Burkholderia sp. SRS-W-2-2016]
MREFLIAPSLLSADFARLADEIRDVTAAGADWIHLDVMDNHYVPNLTFGPLVCSAIRPYSALPFDVHLMTAPVDPLVSAFAEAGANLISFHPEATQHVHRTIELIRSHDARVGLALNPATPLAALDHVLDMLDVVLVMSVNPGFGGQAFIPHTLDKLRRLRVRVDATMQRTGRPLQIEVDGGVKASNIAAIAEAGADVFVAGSAVFGASDRARAISGMRDELASVHDPLSLAASK